MMPGTDSTCLDRFLVNQILATTEDNPQLSVPCPYFKGPVGGSFGDRQHNEAKWCPASAALISAEVREVGLALDARPIRWM